jgi:hypothetical protein
VVCRALYGNVWSGRTESAAEIEFRQFSSFCVYDQICVKILSSGVLHEKQIDAHIPGIMFYLAENYHGLYALI